MEIEFTNARGENLTLRRPSFKVLNIAGLGDVEAEHQSQEAPYQDGSNYIESILDERVIPIELKVSGKDEEDLSDRRRQLNRVFNPKFGIGEMRINIGNKSFIIDAVSDFSPAFTHEAINIGGNFNNCQLQVTAHNPYWKSLNETSKPLQSYVGNFTLPTTFPVQFGISGSSVTLYNEGDIPAPVRIDIQGPVTRPQITNKTTGEWIRVNRAIAADEILHINTAQGTKRVEVYRGNEVYPAFGYLDHDSQWITLEIGKNEISHIADAGDRNSLVAVTWNDMFVGI